MRYGWRYLDALLMENLVEREWELWYNHPDKSKFVEVFYV